MKAKDIILADAIETAIRETKRNKILKKIVCILSVLCGFFAALSAIGWGYISGQDST